MEKINLQYGSGSCQVCYDPIEFEVLLPLGISIPLSLTDIQASLDAPSSTPDIISLARDSKTALIIVSDATRNARTDILLPLIIKRLNSGGIPPARISILFAKGNHREITKEEIGEILGGNIPGEIATFQHNSSDPSSLRNCGTTSLGTEILLNKLLFSHDLVLTISAVSSHYFAGFGGGRKSIFPGVGGKESIIRNHLLSIDFQEARLADGVEPGKLAGNRVHEDFMEIVSHRPPDFSINVLLTDKKEIGGLYPGHWIEAHEAACAQYLKFFGVKLEEKREAVITSCGGFPKDIDLIQSHKAIQYAARALKSGGKLLLLAECQDGTGSPGFENYFPISDMAAFLSRLKTGRVKNGQSALALSHKAKEFQIGMVASLSSDVLTQMGITHFGDISQGMKWLQDSAPASGYIIPQGAVTLPL